MAIGPKRKWDDFERVGIKMDRDLLSTLTKGSNAFDRLRYSYEGNTDGVIYCLEELPALLERIILERRPEFEAFRRMPLISQQATSPTKARTEDRDPTEIGDCIDDMDRTLNPLGRYYRHNHMHAGTIPMVLDEFGRCAYCIKLGFGNRTTEDLEWQRNKNAIADARKLFWSVPVISSSRMSRFTCSKRGKYSFATWVPLMHAGKRHPTLLSIADRN